MAPLPLRVKIIPQSRAVTLNSLPALRPFSSSSPPFPNQNPSPNPGGENADDASPFPPPPRSSSSSIFSDIKERLKLPQAPPRRIPNDPPAPPIAPPEPSPAASLDEIRKHLAEFRLRPTSTSNASPSPGAGPSQDRPTSFQELFNRTAAPSSKPEGSRMSYESIRESLRKIRPSSEPQKFKSLFGPRPDASGPSLIGGQENLPESIFGREMREKEEGGEGEARELKTEFVKAYTHEDLGEKLRRLRPEAAEKGKKGWFSLDELNLRLAKLRELEEKESNLTMGGTMFNDLRQSLRRLKDVDSNKKANVNRMSILAGIGLSSKPSFMLKPPQEHLLENVCSEWMDFVG